VSAQSHAALGVVIVAAGSGTRYGSTPKILAPLAHRTVIEHSLCLLASEPTVDQVVVVLREDLLDAGARLVASLRLPDVSICGGGATRGASVRAGIRTLDPAIGLVAVHDGARPLVSSALFRRVVAAARGVGAAVPGVPPVDTIGQIVEGDSLGPPLTRSTLRAIQTPQVARRDWLEALLDRNDDASDESSLLVAAGFPVRIVEGDPDNIKITRPADLILAESILANRERGQ
jgi:2-C-methyl-D-erythritol 4-phosphate cytidylyltransferase